MLFLVAADRATSLTLCVCTYTPLGVVVAYIYIYIDCPPMNCQGYSPGFSQCLNVAGCLINSV